MTFDGLHIYIFGRISGASEIAVIVKIDVSKLPFSNVTGSFTLSDLGAEVFQMSPDSELPTAGGIYIKHNVMTFDGRDVWINYDPRASQTYSGKLFRLPCAAQRS